MLATHIVDHPIASTEHVRATQIGHSLHRVNVPRWPHLLATVTMAMDSMVDQIAPLMLSMRLSIDVCKKERKKKTKRKTKCKNYYLNFAVQIAIFNAKMSKFQLTTIPGKCINTDSLKHCGWFVVCGFAEIYIILYITIATTVL